MIDDNWRQALALRYMKLKHNPLVSFIIDLNRFSFDHLFLLDHILAV